MGRHIVVLKMICSLGHCECKWYTVHNLSQRRLTADWLAPWESDCSRMHTKVFSNWLPSYIKATWPVLEIFKMAGYFPDSPHMISCIRNNTTCCVIGDTGACCNGCGWDCCICCGGCTWCWCISWGCGCSAGCGVVAVCIATGDVLTAGSASTAVGGADVELLVSSLTIVAADEMLPTLTDSAGFSGLFSLLLLKQKQNELRLLASLVLESNCTGAIICKGHA